MLNDAMTDTAPTATPGATPQVLRRRGELLGIAFRTIGTRPSSTSGKPVLIRDNIAAYLVNIGCPTLFPGPLSLLTIDTPELRNSIDDAAKLGGWVKRAGWVISPSIEELSTATEYAAVACSEFLRRGRPVAWRSVEQVVALAPRRFDDSEEAAEINDEFFELTHVYPLLVIEGVQLVGSTQHEERILLKVLNERLIRRVPTLVIAPAALAARSNDDDSLLVQFLIANYISEIL